MAWAASEHIAKGIKEERGRVDIMDVNGDKGTETMQVKAEQANVDRALDVKDEDVKEVDDAQMDGEADLKQLNPSLLPESPSPSPQPEEDGVDDPSHPKTAEDDQRRSSSSRPTSPQASSKKPTKKKGSVRWSSAGPTQTAEHLPVARAEAMRTFAEIKSNQYQHSKVGRSKGHEKDAIICECHYRHGIDDPMSACGEDAGCINRLTQVECREVDCMCGPYCLNQRFQKHQYADVEIVQTEKKGFGLRARQELSADAFIYEYVGEVVEQGEFMERMQRYKDEGIRHYYFMMLQREEFIDATKRGGVARFINHSCNPNCYVSKWHVGKHMRMGIFSKRAIAPNEELTFNYNVDRYGNEAQPCYCGEPNCVGAIGGKTQTDIGGMDQLFLDALGIADEVDRIEARGSRKKKSRHLGDEDFNPTLHPMQEEEVAKVMTAVRQAAYNRIILQKLLSRIHMTEDVDVHRSLVRLHGFALMAAVLDEWRDDKEIALLVMGSLARLPLLARNKVVDSGADTLVKEFSKSDDEDIRSAALSLVSLWDNLEMSYRIARREASDAPHAKPLSERRRAEDTDDDVTSASLREDAGADSSSSRVASSAPKPLTRNLKPLMNGQSPSPASKLHSPSASDHRRPNSSLRHRHSTHSLASQHAGSHTAKPAARAAVTTIEDIIRNANEAAAAERKKAEEEAALAAADAAAKAARKDEEAKKGGASGNGVKRRSSSSRTTSSSDKKRRTTGSTGASSSVGTFIEQAERKLKKMIGETVVKAMYSFKDDLDRDAFKKHAKELTSILCEKEKRNPKVWPPRVKEISSFLPQGFSSEKKGKIKSFATDYVRKLIAHKASKKHGRNVNSEQHSATATPHDSHRSDMDQDEGDDGGSDDDGVEQAVAAQSPTSSSHSGAESHSLIVARDHPSIASTTTTVFTDLMPSKTPSDSVAHHDDSVSMNS